MTPDARILRALRSADRPLAAPELAASTGLSTDALARSVSGLNAAGYEIEMQPHLGYRLFGAPDKLIADDLAGMLTTPQGEPLRLARHIVVFSETGSTNDVVNRLARSGAAEGAVVFAERQTAGRGRLGRRWESASHKGLWFSILLRPSLAFADWSRLTTWAAVGVARGLEAALPGVKATIKWPNDVYLGGRKAVGILIECATDSKGFAVAGIGVNVNHTRADFPEELASRATSLREMTGPDAPALDRQLVAAALLRQLDSLYSQLAEDFQSIIAEAEARSVLLGKWVEIQTASGIVHGKAEALEADGSLRVRGEEGQVMTVSGGEVSVARWET